MIVATLITAMTFTAALMVPGGYDSNPGPNQGLAILARKEAFSAFSIANNVAFVSSLTALILYVNASNYNSVQFEDMKKEIESKLSHRYYWGYHFTMIALGAVIVAFVTGVYTVLAHSPSLAISMIVIGCLPFVTHLVEYIGFFRMDARLKKKEQY
ncbi:hypothetical protein NMG60_11025530 [Bertholletia excelsa]